VRHSLVAEGVDQPIEYRRRIMSLDRCNDSVPRQTDPGVIDEPSRAGHLADAAEQLDRSVNARRRCELDGHRTAIEKRTNRNWLRNSPVKRPCGEIVRRGSTSA